MALAAVVVSVGTAAAEPTPDYPINIMLSSGPVPGSVWFQWTAQSNGDGTPFPGNPADRYEIRYRYNNPIATENDWLNSTPIDQPPLNISAPRAHVAGSSESINIAGLEPGVTYAFAVKAVNPLGTRSSVNPNPADQVTAVATPSCGKTNDDGQSISNMTMSPTTIQAGSNTIFTISVDIGGSGLDTGGKIAVRVPDFWPQPSTTTATSNPGYVIVTANTAGLSVSTQDQNVIFTATGPTVSGTVTFKYIGFTCEAGTTRKFVASSQYSSCGVLYPSGQQKTVSTVAGDPQFIDFASYDMTYVVNAINKVDLRVVDACRNTVTSTSSVSVTVSPQYLTAASGFVTDPLAQVDTAAAMTSAAASATFNIAGGTQGGSFYYRISASTNKPNDYLKLQHANFQGGPAVTWYANVRPVESGITQASVDTGVLTAGQTAVTFSPDGDGVADAAYINFMVPDRLPWLVEISSDNFASVARRFFGDAQTARVAWDGFADGAPGTPGQIAPPGVYKARISFGGGAVVNNTLQITLSAAGVSGTVIASGFGPLADVDVQIFGVSNRYARTDASGAFTAYGLKTGDYRIRVQKTGYSTVEIPFTVAAGLNAVPGFTMVKQSVVRLLVTRPSGTDLPEIYGQVRANTADWSKQEWGTVHFGRGKINSDAGDTFNVVPTSFTSVTLAPTLNYRLHFEIPNLKVADSTITLNANEIRDVPIVLQRSANIVGNISLPAGASNAAGLWASVEAGPDVNLDGVYDSNDPSKRYYGGVWLSPGESQGRYSIFGVANGSYTITATAPGFAPQKRQVVVSNAVDATADFSSFSVGGVIYGSIVINGDTSGLAGADGYLHVPVNAYSASQQTGSYQDVKVATSASSSFANFNITGLTDGSYDLYSILPGFELSPAGRRTVSVVSSSGAVVLQFEPYTGQLVGDITLPGGATDYANVAITLSPYDNNQPSINISPTSASYSKNGLGTGYYQLAAKYATSGFSISRSIQLVNGKTVRADLDLSGGTYSITGKVTTSARSPYNDIANFLSANAAPTTLTTVSGSTTVPANRIAVERIGGDDGPNNNQNQNGLSFVDLSKTFFVYFAANGDFIVPKLTPGSYRLRTNGELDNNFSNGPEVSAATAIIQVATASATGVVLNIIDGYDVTGTIRTTSADIPTGRTASVRLKTGSGVVIAEQKADLSAAAVSFTLSRIPNGDYVLSVEDDQYPKAFSAKDVRVKVDGKNPDAVSVDILNPARIIGKLRIKTSGTLLTSRNFDQFLSSNFSIEARANPWYSGGYFRAVDPIVNSDGQFVVAANGGKYDIYFRAYQALSAQEISQGKKQFVSLTISGVEVTAGQTLDLGVVDLTEGSTLSGTVRDRSGVALPNVQVAAYPSLRRHNDDAIVTTTNEKGQYTLQGIDVDGARFYDILAAPRSNQGDSRFNNFDGPRYGEVRRTQVDSRANPTVDFVLTPALGVVRGIVRTPDNGALSIPFDDRGAQPGAQIIMNKLGDIPQNNPLGNIEVNSNPDGTFTVPGLVPGTYSCWALASGYGSGFLKNLTVGNGVVDIGTITLQAGQKLYGSLSTADGGAPSKDQLNVIVAVRNGFEEILIGNVTQDAAGNVTDYSISGFQPDKPYTILVFNDNNDINVLADKLVVNSTTKRDFVLNSRSPSILTQYSRNPDGTVNIQFDFTRALRNSATDLDANGIADDSDPSQIIRVVSGSTTTTSGLAFATDWLSSDRRRARVTYTPGATERKFTLRVKAAFNDLDTATGANFATTSDFNYFLGIGKQKEQKFTNANGGTVQLEEDTSEFTAQPGTFGANANDEVNVLFRVADTANTLITAPGVSRVMSVAKDLGASAYPPEMGAAIKKAREASVNPFSSFYDIFLPAGVSHFFPEGREARMCVAYDSGAPDPYALNVYYFNTASNEYILENENKAVDTDNQRICVSLGHASVFTVLASSLPVISGAGYTGDLNVLNFPNPFNLKPKVVTLQSPGSAAASQTIGGTMIKVSVPPSLGASARIEIFSVTGERVRTMNQSITSGAHNYFEWDGTNDAGAKVASGTYIGRLTIDGGNERFFKMAVLK